VLARRYHLIAPLGRGTMGVVWEAYDLAVHRKVAVKEVVLPPDMSQHDREVSRERAQREARAISQLAHPNVIAFYDLVEEHGHPWVVMELVNSRSLADQIRSDGPMPQQRIATLALAVLGALEAAHRAGITHRDVKPSNILLTDDGRVKLTDFGIARTAGDSPITGAGMLVGSPSYIPPEVIQGGEAGPPADMWGLGATLYAAVEARAPFDAGDPMATLHAVVSDPTPSTGRAGPLAPVIDGLLRKDPRRRLDTVKARHLLLDALRAFDRERASAPPPPAPATPLPPVDAVVDAPVELPINGFPDAPLNGAPVNGALPVNGLTPLAGAVPVADFDAGSPYDFRYQEGGYQEGSYQEGSHQEGSYRESAEYGTDYSADYTGDRGTGYDSDHPTGTDAAGPPTDFTADGYADPGVEQPDSQYSGDQSTDGATHQQATLNGLNGTGPINGFAPPVGLNGTGPINGTPLNGSALNGSQPINGSQPTNGYVNGTLNGTTLGRPLDVGTDESAASHSTDSHSTDSHSTHSDPIGSRPIGDPGFDFGAAEPAADFDFGPPAADFDAPPYPAATGTDSADSAEAAAANADVEQAGAPTRPPDSASSADSANSHDFDTAVIPRVPSNEPGPAVAGAMPIARPASGRQAHPLAHLQGFDPASGDGFDLEDDFGTEPWRSQPVFEPARPNPYPLNPPAAAPRPGQRNGAAEGGLAALDLGGSSSGTRQIPALLDDPPRRGPKSTEKGRSGGRAAGVLVALVALCIAGYGGYWLTQHLTGGSGHPAAASPTSAHNSASGTAPTRNTPTRSQPANSRTGDYTPYRGSSFAASIPSGWKSDPQGTGVLDFNDPSNDRFIRFVSNVESSGDLVGGFKAAEQQFTGAHQDYHQIAIHQVSYRGYPAADWEFTYAKDGGTRHVLYRSFTVNSKTYGIYISAPEPLYQATLPVFNEAAKTFAAR
jgi:hypothetical protein